VNLIASSGSIEDGNEILYKIIKIDNDGSKGGSKKSLKEEIYNRVTRILQLKQDIFEQIAIFEGIALIQAGKDFDGIGRGANCTITRNI
jgi:hypothetical protein